MVKKKKRFNYLQYQTRNCSLQDIYHILGFKWGRNISTQLNCKFTKPYSEILSAKLTNHSTCMIENKGHLTSLLVNLFIFIHLLISFLLSQGKPNIGTTT